ncbi:DUF6884 domain-containing protein [Halomontanus rarus]|uniref:DUF6884 domain-containing protein n=1 Tax=Halomontanus rarus TaxID=3034020 RepID=UPI00293BE1C1|nr:DUF6884 domain-containing protein [Halovivax sp. KZCA124]
MSRSITSTEDDTSDGPRVLTVVSCGETKQDLDDGETVPARELYTSNVHKYGKDRYGRRSHGYYIASAKFGLVHHETELPDYDKTLSDMSDEEIAVWAEDVSSEIQDQILEDGYDAVVIIRGEDSRRSRNTLTRLTPTSSHRGRRTILSPDAVGGCPGVVTRATGQRTSPRSRRSARS